MASYSSDIRFKCPACLQESQQTILVPEPNWMEDKAIDRMVEEEIDIECSKCEEVFEAKITNWDSQINTTFPAYPTVQVSCSMGFDREPDDFWDDIPDSPADEFKTSVNEALALLDNCWSDSSGGIITRMVFIHCFAALEVYLGDTLLNYVNANDVALMKMLTEDKDLKDEKLSLAEFLKDEDVVFKKVMMHLQQILYHNLAKVHALYTIATGLNIFPDNTVKGNLFQALQFRHDCVHRNGKNKQGDIQSGITKDYIKKIVRDMMSLVDHIECSIEAQQN